MKAMLLKRVVSLQDNPEPLTPEDFAVPQPAPEEVLIQVSACGVCHTELDEIEGRTPPSVLPMIPGHEVVGRVTEKGDRVTRLDVGDRVGVGWIFKSTGDDNENISDNFVATGRDANGGYAEYMTVHERYAYRIPDCFTDYEAAPLLCAGGVGYRALKLTNIRNGDVLGLTGFGGSGHLVLQLARYLYPKSPTYVFARSSEEREFAIELGAAWAGDTGDTPPEPPHAIIDTTPAWRPVLAALKCLRPGGRLVINAIRKENTDISLMAEIDYTEHLWQEKEMKTVANVTSHDIRAFLEIAAAAGIRPEVQVYPLEEANRALCELNSGHVRGAKVLAIGQ
ncbi:MAG: alcohol dehydrogenase catalytic domain-containing protein [Woeseiaceae bacterium]|nr:alcohol dehydrogenase catalytic domain-containing protein [Woeseiaceae bacterium]MDX2607850.1 alcohol dehydrogenase catalytic domain-containing protein [Woeseiaceae bacterium]